jgi:hypothetical protein
MAIRFPGIVSISILPNPHYRQILSHRRTFSARRLGDFDGIAINWLAQNSQQIAQSLNPENSL